MCFFAWEEIHANHTANLSSISMAKFWNRKQNWTFGFLNVPFSPSNNSVVVTVLKFPFGGWGEQRCPQVRDCAESTLPEQEEHSHCITLGEHSIPNSLCFTKAHIFSRRVLMLSVNIIVVKQWGYLSYHSVCVCHLQELCAALCISKRANPQAVGRMKLFHEEIAAYLNDLG